MSLTIVTWEGALHRQAPSLETARKKFMESQRFVLFALWADYGKDYGHVKRVYDTTKPLRLLDLSTMAMRAVIAAELGMPLAKLSPDDQYSGGAGNHVVHNLLLPLLVKHRLDGTIIEEHRADDDCQGPTEIVLRGCRVRHVLRVFNKQRR